MQLVKDVASGEPIGVEDESTQSKLRKVRSLLFRSPFSRYYYPMMIGSAKCPIVKMTISNMIKKPKERIVDFDFNLSHPVGVFNSHIIKIIVNSEPRFQQLIVILKNWAKLNNLIELSAFRSYTLTFLVVFFLQNCNPSFILSLDNIYDYSRNFSQSIKPDFENEIFEKCAKLVQNTDKLPSTFDLIHQFFS